MSTLGNRLRSTRMGKGMSLEQLSESTKISVTSLECIENNEFSDLPEIIIRGFIRSICQVLQLDEEKHVGEFNALCSGRGKRVSFTARSSKPLAAKPKHGRLRLIVALVVFLLLGSLLLLVVFKPATMRGSDHPAAPPLPAAAVDTTQR